MRVAPVPGGRGGPFHNRTELVARYIERKLISKTALDVSGVAALEDGSRDVEVRGSGGDGGHEEFLSRAGAHVRCFSPA